MTAQQEFEHYYLKLDGAKEEKFDIEIGMIDLDAEFNPTRRKLDHIQSLSQLNNAINTSLSQENTSKQLNIVIHGIWGDLHFAWNEMIQNLSQDVYSTDDGKKKVMLSIIWDSSINYFTGVKIARNKGDFLGPFFKELTGLLGEEIDLNMLCHSMGNRIFQHMILSSGLIDEEKVVIDHYISAGADLESNIFDEGQPLHGVDKIVGDFTIYVHNNDRSLKMSKLVNKNRRLGLHGLDPYRMPENFRLIDVSTITDHRNFITSMSNHRYFYMSPTVTEDIKRLVWKKGFSTNKNVLDHPRRLQLKPIKSTP